MKLKFQCLEIKFYWNRATLISIHAVYDCSHPTMTELSSCDRHHMVMENVRASRPEATRDEVRAALSAAQCDDILEKLPDGMDTVIGTEGTYLSGGEQQRVALARAILKDAPIVVLDEATAFADPENEAMIQKAFATLTKGRTVIMIAHRLSTVVGADKIIVLDNGKVSEEGTHTELIQKGGLYARMWKEYNQAVKWRISQVDPSDSVSADKEVQ